MILPCTGDRHSKPFVIPKPEVIVIPRARGDDCLILASDGMWDVMSNEEACRTARVRIFLWYKRNGGAESDDDGGEPTAVNPAAQSAADYLVNLALTRGSTDNITVTVIDLRRRRKTKVESLLATTSIQSVTKPHRHDSTAEPHKCRS